MIYIELLMPPPTQTITMKMLIAMNVMKQMANRMRPKSQQLKGLLRKSQNLSPTPAAPITRQWSRTAFAEGNGSEDARP
jgi:hypothetical protein